MFPSYLRISVTIFLISLITGCKLPAIHRTEAGIALPGAYAGIADTANDAAVGWKMFHASHLLGDLIDTVLTNNPDMLIAAQRVEYAQAHQRQAAGQLLPQVNGVLTPSMRKFGLYTMDGAGNIVTDIQPGKTVPVDLPDFHVGFQASWEADLWGKLRARKRAAMARVLATSAYRHLVQTTLVAETALAYYELLAAEQELRILDQTIGLQQQAVELVRIQKQAAVVNELAVRQFEAQLLGMESLRIQVLQQSIDAEARIRLLAGRPGANIPKDTAYFNAGPLPEVKVGLPASLLYNRPDVRRAEFELAASREDVLAARAAFLPSLMITGNLGLQAYLPGLLTSIPQSVMYGLVGGLTAPLLNRAYIKAEYAKAGALEKEGMLNYRRSVIQAFVEVDRELKNSRNLARIYDLKNRETAVLTRAVDVSSQLFMTGRSNYLDVLFSRQNQLRSNLELISTRKAQFMSAVHLYKAIGGGWR